MSRFSSIAMVAAVVTVGSNSVASAQNGFLNVTIVNDSNVTASIGVRMINGQYLWKQVPPGGRWRDNVQHFFFAPFVQGQQTVQVAIRYNGVTRTSSLPIFRYSFTSYAGGRVFRRSPGVLGLQNAAGPP